MNAEYDELLSDIEGEEDTNEETDQGASSDDDGDVDGSEESSGAEPEQGEGKRINDLMSKWQKAESRAKKAEEERDALQQKGDGAPDPKMWVELMREQARDTVYASDPRLARYGIEPSAIDGDTPQAMQASLSTLKGLIDRIETDASNRTLKKHGLTADVKGKAAERGPVIPESDEDFEKLVEKIRIS